MDAIELIALASSISLLAGWRLYLVTFVTGLAMKMGWIDLPERLQALDVLAPDEVDLGARRRVAAFGVAAVRGAGEHPGNALDQWLFGNGHPWSSCWAFNPPAGVWVQAGAATLGGRRAPATASR